MAETQARPAKAEQTEPTQEPPTYIVPRVIQPPAPRREKVRVTKPKPEPKPKTEKRCPKCGVTKPLTEFWKRGKNDNRLESWCKTCKVESHKPAMRAYYLAHREEILARNNERKRRLRGEG